MGGGRKGRKGWRREGKDWGNWGRSGGRRDGEGVVVVPLKINFVEP